jgi:hypothetical protein
MHVGGRIKTSHFFCFKPGGDILARSDFALGLIHREASERSGFRSGLVWLQLF